MAVKLLEVCRVAPLPIPPASAIPKSLPLTFFDLHWLNFPPTQRLLFYALPHHHPISSFSDSILPKLKHSLSLTLHHFRPLAGTLLWPSDSDEPFIRISESAAVSVTIAESNADFHRLSGDEFREATEYHPLVPYLPITETEASIIALQITAFPNGGFSIGIASHHAVVDGKTSTMFLKSWSSICRLGGEGCYSLPPDLTPFYDRSVVNDPKGIKRAYLNERRRLMGPNGKSLMVHEVNPPERTIRGTFVLNRAHIEKLREKCLLSPESQKHKHLLNTNTRISTLSLTLAYTWVCLIKTQEVENQSVYIGFPADCRSRLDPPIPETYFGNCLFGCLTNVNVSDLVSEDGVAIAAWAITEVTKKLKEEEPPKEPEKWLSIGKVFRTEKVTSIAGSPQFGLYGTDFGWGRPRKTELVSIDRNGNIGVGDSREVGSGGGVEVCVVLEEEQMKAFDSLFVSGLEALEP